MYGPTREYDVLLADIKRQLSRIKTDLSPTQALEMVNEVQCQLNRVLADAAESAHLMQTWEYNSGSH